MKIKNGNSEYSQLLNRLKHYLPAQAPLKDFIHHNTLHSFQDLPFSEGIIKAARIFGYTVLLSKAEYQRYYQNGQINKEILIQHIKTKKGEKWEDWFSLLLDCKIKERALPRIGSLRSNWKNSYQIDLDSLVHPILFRVVSSYLDQGIALWNFPYNEAGFIASIRELEKVSKISFFRSERARKLLLNEEDVLDEVIQILIGDKQLVERYFFDQQFAHSGWSGMVSTVEDHPRFLTNHREISLRDFILFECLLEIDALDDQFGEIWSPIAIKASLIAVELFDDVQPDEEEECLLLWHEAFELSYYHQVVEALSMASKKVKSESLHSFQALFCIDDRECSMRRHLETVDPLCETFGTPGFFNVPIFYQPSGSSLLTKLCPAPVTPKHLIKEINASVQNSQEIHFNKHAHGLFAGWVITHTVGFFSAIKLVLSVFWPRKNASSVASFDHCAADSKLSVDYEGSDNQTQLQVGFTLTEMAGRVEGLLRSIGLTDKFAKFIFCVAHGSSSVNNTHFAGYDCGACSGRPGSVNARVIAEMANNTEVRILLRQRGIDIPDSTLFVAALHDTSRDEIEFYSPENIDQLQKGMFEQHKRSFRIALELNANERSRRFESISFNGNASKVHRKVKRRTVSLFEPRPELNHATNALAIVGGRHLTKNVFLDRRAFLNSYDYEKDTDGSTLNSILSAVAPVCGGINLEYFFSRVDNNQLGAGTKLPHNVIGLIGVANGTDGDLRTGLPSQMIEVHDPLRLCVIVEQIPDKIAVILDQNEVLKDWFKNEWIHLLAIHPVTSQFYWYQKGQFEVFKPLPLEGWDISELESHLYTYSENIPVTHLN